MEEAILTESYENLPGVIEENKFFKRILQNSQDGIYIVDGRQGTLGETLYCNKKFAELSGVALDEVKGKNIFTFNNKYVNKISTIETIKTNRPTTIIQTMTRTHARALVTSTPVYDNEGKPLFYLVKITDLADYENLVERAKHEETHENKLLAALGNIGEETLSVEKGIIAADLKMMHCIEIANRVAKYDTEVLITGETGTGKEVIAEYIHRHSDRKNGPFIAVNCAALHGELFESELFGYEPGSFTGASKSGKQGLFEAASGGTIFLDEIGELPLSLQPKLLRALNEKQIMHVGGVTPIKTNVRVISATNRSLIQMINDGLFRDDLYFRITTVPIHLPSLRERRGDIIPMAETFLEKHNRTYNDHKQLSERSKQALLQYEWPGNIRQLRNVIENAAILSSEDIINPGSFAFYKPDTSEKNIASITYGTPLETTLEQIELYYLDEAYKKAGSGRKAAEMLQMKHSTFANRYNVLKQKYGCPSDTQKGNDND